MYEWRKRNNLNTVDKRSVVWNKNNQVQTTIVTETNVSPMKNFKKRSLTQNLLVQRKKGGCSDGASPFQQDDEVPNSSTESEVALPHEENQSQLNNSKLLISLRRRKNIGNDTIRERK